MDSQGTSQGAGIGTELVLISNREAYRIYVRMLKALMLTQDIITIPKALQCTTGKDANRLKKISNSRRTVFFLHDLSYTPRNK